MHQHEGRIDARSDADIAALRRHQRRLLWGGGGLITLLVLLAVLVAVVAEVNDFHASQRQRFSDARASVDYYLFQRDRAYASNINGNDAMWQGQQAHLRERGEPLVDAFLAQGEALVVRDDGAAAVPWLVLGRGGVPLERGQLAAYLGMMLEYSAYTSATVAALRSQGQPAIFAYEPEGRLLAVAGVTDEAQLLHALGVRTREDAFARLLAVEPAARRVAPLPGPVQSAVASGRLQSWFDTNPVTGAASLAGVQTLADANGPYFRRVVYEPVETIRTRLEERDEAPLAVFTHDGRTVLRSAGMPASVAPVRPDQRSAASGGVPQRRWVAGRFQLSGPVDGVDWTVVTAYGWNELWQAKGTRLLLQLLAACVIVVVVWTVLLRLERRVFAPALAGASRVYESEALSRIIIDTSPIGLVLLDPGSGSPLLENGLAREMAALADGQDVEGLYARVRTEVTAAEPAPTHEFALALPARVGRGGTRQLQVVVAAASWRLRGVWVCALRDVTAQVELERTLHEARHDAERARAAAESASRAKTAFVATMSHEIRTPLNGVLGHLELLARSPLAPAQQERLDRIRLSADTLLGIISDVLDFSKIEAGQLDIVAAPFQVRPLVEQAALLYSADALRKGVKLYYAVDPALEGEWLGDVHRIRQILNNLLSNAVKFTESGRIALRAQLRTGADGARPRLLLQVVDSGIGLTEDQLAQLFQPFQQADAGIARRYGGSGLGLALCQQLAQLLGGHLQADSTAGVGSVFTLELPVDAVATPDRDHAPPQLPLQGRAVTLLSAAAEWRTEIGQLLMRWGAEANVIEQPRQAGEVAPDAILLLFGERRAWEADEERALAERHARVVRAQPNGPLAPDRRDDGLHVSTYSSTAVLDALVQGASATRRTAAAAPGPVRSSRGEVLLVEDNPVNRELIQQQLETLGFAVTSAVDGHDALENWAEPRFVAVLTDINMPNMDGYQLASALRARGVAVPILAITATALASERERCRDAGITDLLLKPLGLQVLARAMDQHLAAGAPPGPGPTDGDDAQAGRVPAPRAGDEASATLPGALLQVFIDSSRQDIATLRAASAAGNRAQLLDRVHALKGVLMMVGERVLGQRCSDLEARLREPGQSVDADEVAALLQALDAMVERHARRRIDTA